MSVQELYKICEVGDVHGATALLIAGAQPSAAVGASTPLHCACENGHTKLVAELLKYADDINVTISTGLTPLHRACGIGFLDVVRELCSKGANVEASDSAGFTPLHHASSMGNADVVEELIRFEADPNGRCHLNGNTPLHVACTEGHLTAVRVLLRNGADVNAINEEGLPPLFCVLRTKRYDILRELLERGARVDVKSQDDWTALHVACNNGEYDIARVLLEAGAKADSINCKGYAPIHYAARLGNCDLVELLLHFNVDVNVIGRNGMTALHFAAYVGNPELVDVLLSAGADTNMLTSHGKSPIDLAKKHNHVSVVHILEVRRTAVTYVDAAPITHLLEEISQITVVSGQPVVDLKGYEINTSTNLKPVEEGVAPTPVARRIVSDGGDDQPFALQTSIGEMSIIEDFVPERTNDVKPRSDEGRLDEGTTYVAQMAEIGLAPSRLAPSPVAGPDIFLNNLQPLSELLPPDSEEQYTTSCPEAHPDDAGAAVQRDHDLLIAASSGNVRAVNELILAGANVNFSDQNGVTPLHEASAHGNINVVRALLDAGADINCKECTSHTPLHYAIRRAQDEVVCTLLFYGADPDIGGLNGLTPLHWASFMGNGEIARVLINVGADKDMKNDYGLTPLQVAEQRSATEVIEVFASLFGQTQSLSNPTLYEPTVAGPSLLEPAMSDPTLPVRFLSDPTLPVRSLSHPSLHEPTLSVPSLREPTMPHPSLHEPTVKEQSLSRLLQPASLEPHPAAGLAQSTGATAAPSKTSSVPEASSQSNTLKDDLLNGASTPNTKRNKVPSNSLKLPQLVRPGQVSNRISSLPTIRSNSEEVSQTQMNETEQHLLSAIKKGDIMQVTRMLHCGARVNVCTEKGDTLLHEAVTSGFQDVLLSLIEAGANLNARDKNSNTPLHYAVRQRRAEIVRLLIKYGADVDSRGFNGATPLHWASYVGDLGIARVLLEEGAHPRLLTSEQKLPLVIARERQHFEVAALLEKAPSRFYSVLFAKHDELSLTELHNRLGSCIGDVHEMKIYYTLLRAHIAQKVLSPEEGREYLKLALGVAATTCVTEDAVACFKVVLEKCRRDKLLDEVHFHKFDNRAEVHRMENAEFILDMNVAIRKNTARIDNLEVTVKSIIDNIKILDENIRKVNSQVSEMKSAFRRKMKRDAAFGFVSCVLGVVGGGFIGTLCSAVTDVFNIIVDFGDVSHVLDVIATQFNGDESEEMAASFKKGMEFGRKLLEQTNSYLTGRIVAEAMKEGDPLLVLGLGATIANPDHQDQSNLNSHNKPFDALTGIYEDAIFPEEEEDKLPLHAAVKFGKRKHLEDALVEETLIEKDIKRTINTEDSKGRTAMDLAALTGQLDLMKLLEENGGKFKYKSAPRMEAIAEMRSKNVEQYLHHVKLQLEY